MDGVLLIRRPRAHRRAVDPRRLIGHKTGAFVQTQQEQDPPDELEDRVDHVQRGVVGQHAAAGVADGDVGRDEVGGEGQPPDPAGHLRVAAADEQVRQDPVDGVRVWGKNGVLQT